MIVERREGRDRCRRERERRQMREFRFQLCRSIVEIGVDVE
jgi:hypothetical protein